MYGSLGYIDNGRRGPQRDAFFMGGTGNPARKELNGAVSVSRRPDALTGPGTLAPANKAHAGGPVLSPPQPTMPENVQPSHTSLLERRCAFLEDQDKRRAAELADVRARLAQQTGEPEKLAGVVQLETVQQDDPYGRDAAPEAIARSLQGADVSSRAKVARGTNVQLTYPMVRVLSGGATQVWMRRRMVCPYIAEVTYAWLLLFEEKDGAPDTVYVSQFN